MTFDADVLVVGGGPVGLAAAIEARRRGLSAVVIEPRSAPVDKACGEGLMPSALRRLGDLGIDPPGRAFVGIRYLRDHWQATADFPAGPGRGVRRTELHAALVRCAAELGVHWHQDRVDGVEQDAVGAVAAGLRGRWLLGADGLHSTVRVAAGLQRPAGGRGSARFGLRRHVAVAPWTDHVEVHWSPRVEAYVTPVGEDLVGVAVLGPPGTGFDAALADLPGLRARLRGGAYVTATRGAGPLRQRATGVWRGRVLLVGDAAGYVDALTGEGISVGLATARAAVEAIAEGRPEAYPRAWSRATWRYRWVTSGLLGLSAHPAPRRLLVPAVASLPRVFARAVATIS